LSKVENIGRVKGTAYKIAGESSEGIVLGAWKKDTTFDELKATLKVPHCLTDSDTGDIGYYNIEAHIRGISTENGDLVGFFIPRGVNKDVVLAHLEELFGPDTQFMHLSKRQRAILQALKEIGGTATTREVAEKTDLNVNGVAQSLGALYYYVKCLGGIAGETRWKMKKAAFNYFNRTI